MGNTTKISRLARRGCFNVFNWKNYGTYNTTITSPLFGQPASNSGNAYVPREGQLGARLVF